MLSLIEVWVLFTLPASLELHSNQLIFTKFLTDKIIATPYKDIQEIIFKDRSTGRGKDIGYYLVFKCVQNVKRKIPIGALIQDREKQAELIQFILQKNPCIRFPYRPRQSNDDIWLGWWIKL